MIATDKKELIISVAMKLWQKTSNVNKVHLAEIADAAGVSPATINRLFGTRAGLVHSVIQHLLTDILDKQKAILKSDAPFPEKIQGMISVKWTPIKGIEPDLMDKICTDPVERQFVEQIKEKEAKPMLKELLKAGRKEGYIRPEIPDDVIMLYFEMLQSGFVYCSDEMKRLVADKDSLLALTRLIYFGLFQKEFAVSFAKTAK